MGPTKDYIAPAWARDIQAWTQHLAMCGRAQTTIASRETHLRWVAKAFPKESTRTLTKEALHSWLGTKQWATETRRGVYNSLRSYYVWAVETEFAPENLGKTLPTIRPAPPRRKSIPDSVLEATLEDKISFREWLILMLARNYGLRRMEIAQVNKMDITHSGTGWQLTVHGKGNVTRIVPLEANFAQTIFLVADSDERGWLFPGKINGHLSARYVGKIAARALPDDWTLHNLRNRFANAAYQNTGDIISVQELLGHANLNTTRIYVDGNDDRRREAVARASITQPRGISPGGLQQSA